MEQKDYRNFSYFFIPFFLKDQGCFNDFVRDIEASGCWKTVREKLTYMFRFVADKLGCTDPEDRRVVHYILDGEDPGVQTMELVERWFGTTPLAYKGEKTASAFWSGMCSSLLSVPVCAFWLWCWEFP